MGIILQDGHNLYNYHTKYYNIGWLVLAVLLSYWPNELTILPIYLLMPIFCPLEDLGLELGPTVIYSIMELEHTFPQMFIGTLGVVHLELEVDVLVN
jgi:hypothetical protein